MRRLIVTPLSLAWALFAMTSTAAEDIVVVQTVGGVTSRTAGAGEWLHGLPTSVRLRMEKHLELHGSIRSRPPMINGILGVDFEPARNLPAAVFRHIIDASPEAPTYAMWESLNIQVLSPDHPIELPANVVLRTSLTHQGAREYVDMKMSLREGAYHIAYPTEVMADNMEAAQAFIVDAGGKQRSRFGFEIHDLSGFTFSNTTVTSLPPLGAPVTVNVRFGDVRVDTLFQWVGRPASIPFNDGREFLR